MNSTRFDLVIFGATSFVGQILARYLATHLAGGSDGLRWALAGRSLTKLQELKASLGQRYQDLPLLLADTTRHTEIEALCTQTRVLVSTVGPYAVHGEPVIKACAENGTDYCDLTGETLWIKRMIEKYQQAAQRSGARIVPCCGFDSVPSDMGVWALQQEAVRRWGSPAAEITMRVKGLKGGASGGTVASLLHAVEEAMSDPALRKDLNNPFSLCPPTSHRLIRQHQVKSVEFDRGFEAWTAPFVMAAVNERVVHRSNSLLGFAYGPRFSYNEALLTGSGALGWLRASAITTALGAFFVSAMYKPSRQLMQNFLLPSPGEGPSPAAQKAGSYDLRLLARSERGARMRFRVAGDQDPGYGSTAKMLGQAALYMALDLADGNTKVGQPGGFWTPASCFGQRYIDRLCQHAGLVFELDPEAM